MRLPFSPQHEFFRALKAADKARRRGDHKTCAHWMKLADASLKLAERMRKIAALQQRDEDERDVQKVLVEEITDEKYERWAAKRAAEAAG